MPVSRVLYFQRTAATRMRSGPVCARPVGPREGLPVRFGLSRITAPVPTDRHWTQVPPPFFTSRSRCFVAARACPWTCAITTTSIVDSGTPHRCSWAAPRYARPSPRRIPGKRTHPLLCNLVRVGLCGPSAASLSLGNLCGSPLENPSHLIVRGKPCLGASLAASVLSGQ